MEYYCPSCDKRMKEPICPIHKTPNQPVEQGATDRKDSVRKARAPEPEPPAEEAGDEELEEEEEEEDEGVEEEEHQKGAPLAATQPAPGPTPSQSATSTRKVDPGSIRRLKDYQKESYEMYLISGIGGTGKTEMLGALRQDGYLDRITRRDGKALRTAQSTLDCHPVSMEDGRRVVFVDASGEDFRLLYPEMQQTGEIDESDIEFLRLITERLRGLVLLIELKRLWTEKDHAQYSGNAEQAKILNWILALVRWMHYDGRYTPGAISLQDQVNRSVLRMKKRLKIPVQVIFSKADELVGFPVPAKVLRAGQIRQQSIPDRRASPIGEDPLLFAYHCVPALYKGVRDHTDYFRFDFAHSLVTDPKSKAVSDSESCGVTLALKWLLDPIWQSRWPLVSSRRWIGWQSFLDESIWRNKRWRRLQEPMEVDE